MKGKAINESEKVDEYMLQLQHPLKAEMEAVRQIIKSANPVVIERVKWAAPSFHALEDMATFNHRATKHVHLVFHNAAVLNNSYGILQGDYKDRRMAYFSSLEDIELKKTALQQIVNDWITYISNNNS